MLGCLIDELVQTISQLVSTAPKSYSFKYGNSKQKRANKGFSLNYQNTSILDHDSLTKIVKNQIKDITNRK